MISLIFTYNLFINVNSFAEDNLKKIFENKFPNYLVLNYRKGNFTNSKLDEYVVFYKEIKIYKAPPTNTPKAIVDSMKRDFDEISKRNDITKVVVFILKNNEIKGLYELKVKQENSEINLISLEYNKYYLEIIKRGDPQFGTWDDYCYLNDFNGNGLDEILFFVGSGMGLIPYIFEFKDNKVQVVLDITPVYDGSISELKTINKNGKNMIKVYCIGYNVQQKGKRDYYEYSWDSQKQIYTMIEKGIE